MHSMGSWEKVAWSLILLGLTFFISDVGLGYNIPMSAATETILSVRIYSFSTFSDTSGFLFVATTQYYVVTYMDDNALKTVRLKVDDPHIHLLVENRSFAFYEVRRTVINGTRRGAFSWGFWNWTYPLRPKIIVEHYVRLRPPETVVRVLVNQTRSAVSPVVFGDCGSAEFAAFDFEVYGVDYVAPSVGLAFLFGQSLHGAHPQYSPLGRVGFKHYYPMVVGGVS